MYLTGIQYDGEIESPPNTWLQKWRNFSTIKKFSRILPEPSITVLDESFSNIQKFSNKNKHTIVKKWFWNAHLDHFRFRVHFPIYTWPARSPFLISSKDNWLNMRSEPKRTVRRVGNGQLSKSGRSWEEARCRTLSWSRPSWTIVFTHGLTGAFKPVRPSTFLYRPLLLPWPNQLEKLTIRRRSNLVKVLTTIVSRTVFENFLHLGIKSKIVSIFFEWSNINDFICSIRVIEAFKPVPKIND